MSEGGRCGVQRERLVIINGSNDAAAKCGAVEVLGMQTLAAVHALDEMSCDSGIHKVAGALIDDIG